MNKTNLVPRGTSAAIADNESALYDLLLRLQLKPQPVAEAIGDSPFSISTYYRWQREESEWFNSVLERAKADAQQLTKNMQGQLVAKRVQKQIETDNLLLDNIYDVIAQMIVEAKAGDDKAAKIVLEATKKGAVFDRETAPPDVAEVWEELPYDPHTTGPAQMNLTVPLGTKVTVETPDPVLDLPTQE
jgi:hypothetical protein